MRTLQDQIDSAMLAKSAKALESIAKSLVRIAEATAPLPQPDETKDPA